MVFPRLFSAEARAWENFCRIRQIFRVECAPDALHGFEVGFSKHLLHHHFFLFTDTVLAGDRTAGLDAELKDAVS
jgi:hypothetical protein